MVHEDFYFTFGDGQPNFPGHVKIKAADETIARKLMFDEYGIRWCWCYKSFDRVNPKDRRQVKVITQKLDKAT